MRTALILLVVVALVLVALGAVNHGLLFDVDFVAGTWTAVSLFWVAVGTAGLVFVTGVVAAFLARAGVVAGQRKLEKELQDTYKRLRAAESKLPRPAPSEASVVDPAPGEQTAVTGIARPSPAAETSIVTEALPEAETAVSSSTDEAETAVTSATDEAETVADAALPEADTVVDAAAPATDVADAPPPAAS